MSYEKPTPVSVTALRAEEYSDEGRSLIISLTTKHSAAERRYSVPLECFSDLIGDLKRLQASQDVGPPTSEIHDTAPENRSPEEAEQS